MTFLPVSKPVATGVIIWRWTKTVHLWSVIIVIFFQFFKEKSKSLKQFSCTFPLNLRHLLFLTIFKSRISWYWSLAKIMYLICSELIQIIYFIFYFNLMFNRFNMIHRYESKNMIFPSCFLPPSNTNYFNTIFPTPEVLLIEWMLTRDSLIFF